MSHQPVFRCTNKVTHRLGMCVSYYPFQKHRYISLARKMLCHIRRWTSNRATWRFITRICRAGCIEPCSRVLCRTEYYPRVPQLASVGTKCHRGLESQSEAIACVLTALKRLLNYFRNALSQSTWIQKLEPRSKL